MRNLNEGEKKLSKKINSLFNFRLFDFAKKYVVNHAIIHVIVQDSFIRFGKQYPD
jgi:hypothetical protein